MFDLLAHMYLEQRITTTSLDAAVGFAWITATQRDLIVDAGGNVGVFAPAPEASAEQP